jgi:hypothetical protein
MNYTSCLEFEVFEGVPTSTWSLWSLSLPWLEVSMLDSSVHCARSVIEANFNFKFEIGG